MSSISLALYDDALNIGKLELEALKSGEVEAAEEYCLQRAELLEKAWSIRDPADNQIRAKLIAIDSLQKELVKEGKKLRVQIQEQLSKSRQQQQRLKGYKQAVGQANSALEEKERFSTVAH